MDNLLIKLQDLSNFIEQGTLEENLQQLAELSANILNAENSSIMLLNDGENYDLKLRVCACFGFLPAEAYKQSTGKNDGIAGYVLATGKSVLIEDINNSGFANQARRGNDPRKSLISSPISINKRIVGVVNICNHLRNSTFTQQDLSTLEIIALFIGKSIQAVQLQNILNSRFAQLALVNEMENNAKLAFTTETIASTIHNNDKIAKILAKSFYKEMTRAGLSPGQIISAASEIIAQLNKGLQRYNKRLTRNPKDNKST